MIDLLLWIVLGAIGLAVAVFILLWLVIGIGVAWQLLGEVIDEIKDGLSLKERERARLRRDI